MKSVKNQVKSINATSVSSISTIDRYNQYESNQIYRFLSIYRLLSIDYSGKYTLLLFVDVV